MGFICIHWNSDIKWSKRWILHPPTDGRPSHWQKQVSAFITLPTYENTIYYFLVYKMEMQYYNFKYSYWKRCSISRHHITAQAFCVPLIGAYAKSSYDRCELDPHIYLHLLLPFNTLFPLLSICWRDHSLFVSFLKG